jgi:hypothetical protein
MSQQLLAAWAIAMILGVNLNAKPNKKPFVTFLHLQVA